MLYSAVFAQDNLTWSFVAAGTVGTGSNTVVPVPSGIQSGDLLIIVAGSNGTSFTTPSGWTSIAIGSGIGAPCMAAFYKVAGASESSVTLNVSQTACKGVMIAYRGVSTLDANSSIAVATATTLATSSITTSVNGALVISMYANERSGGTFTAPSGTTTRVLSDPNGSVDGILIVDEIQTTAGATTARTATQTLNKNINALAAAFK